MKCKRHTRRHICCYCAENYGTEATSCRVFSLVYQNEIEMGMSLKL